MSLSQAKKKALEMVFETEYKRLNKEQKRAVDSIEGPVMVIAGPGTGKTTVLTLRIANILQKTDTPAHGILAITYTDAGVKAMREKLKAIIGSRAHEVSIHTFHSFASAMISEYPDHFIHLGDATHMGDVEAESLIRSIIMDTKFSALRPIGKPDAYVTAILRSIDNAKREAILPKDVRAHAKKEKNQIESDESSISTRGQSKGQLKAEAREQIEKCERTLLFADIYELYEQSKHDQKKMDFNDLIFEFLVRLQTDELFLRLIQERFLYVHVDEHQDTNDSQNLIVALIAEFFETPNIFIVGDEKQAIYRFQGASVENFLRLRKRWPAMKLISLDTNYRSHQSLLDAGFAMIEKNYTDNEQEDLRVRLVSGSSIPNREVEVVEGENVLAVETYLIDELKIITKNEPQATVAVITRRNRDLERVLRVIESNNIPVSSERSIDIFHHPVGVLFFNLLEYLDDMTKTDALARTIAAHMWGLDFEKGFEIIKSLRAGKNINLESAIPELKVIKNKILQDSPLEFLIDTAGLSGFTNVIIQDPSYTYVWRGIVTLAESIVRGNILTNPAELLSALLAYRASAESKTVKVSVGAPDLPIKVMTAHGSKGLEFDYVFLPYTTEEAWIGRTRGSSFVLPRKQAGDNDIQDIRRLFYVALTRAKKHAVILVPTEESDGKELTPLRFIDELDPLCVTNKTLKRKYADLVSQSGQISDHRGSSYSTKILAQAMRVLIEQGLSVTALNHFLECPNKFLYESVLRLPQAPHPSAEKGTAMHQAISAVWKSDDKSIKNIEKIIVSEVASYLESSFLAGNEKKLVQKELTETALSVAGSLVNHFSTKGKVTTDRSVKVFYEGIAKSEPIKILLHGKLDAVIEDGDGVSVFDYKTKQTMSVNEIMGLTKNSDGNYFRQLVFYKILLSGEPHFKSKSISTALVFISPDKKGNCSIITLPVTENDRAQVGRDIQSVIDAVWDGSLATSFCKDPDCMYCKLRKVVTEDSR